MTAWLATWRHRHEDGPLKGELVIPIRGALVLEYAHNPTQGFVALLLLGDGTTREEQVKNLLIRSDDDQWIQSQIRASPAPPGPPLEADHNATALAVPLGDLTDASTHQADLNTVRSIMVDRGLLEINSEEATLHAATRLLGDLCDTLKQVDADRVFAQGERNIAIEERDAALARADELSKELEAALAKKRGKKADAPGGAARE